MSTLTSYASASARDSAAPAASNTGLCIFRSDTKTIEVSDGTNYLTYNNDGVTYYNFSGSNSHSGEFDGAGDYIHIATVAATLNASSNFSLACYFNVDSTASIQHIFGAGTSSSNRIWGQIRNSTTIRIGVVNTYDEFTVSTLSTGTWYHLVCSISGTSCTLYLNGNSQGSVTVNSLTSTIFNNFQIGLLPTAAGFPSGLYYDGKLDELAIFNRALTSTEVSDIYDDKIYAQPTAMYRLDDGVTDETGNYNGTNNGVSFSAKADDPANTPY